MLRQEYRGAESVFPHSSLDIPFPAGVKVPQAVLTKTTAQEWQCADDAFVASLASSLALARTSSCFTADTMAHYNLIANDGTLDPECRALWDVLESIPGIELIAACSGHGVRPLSVWFSVTRLDALALVLGASTWIGLTATGWQCAATAQSPWAKVVFRLESDTCGSAAYAEAAALAGRLGTVRRNSGACPG